MGGFCSVLFSIIAVTIVALLLTDLINDNIRDRHAVVPPAVVGSDLLAVEPDSTYSVQFALQNYNDLNCQPQKPKLQDLSLLLTTS